LKTSKHVIRNKLNEYRRDRQGAGDAWSGHKTATTGRPAADNPRQTESFRSAEATAGGPRSAAVNVEPAPKVTPPTAGSPTMGGTPAHVPPTVGRPNAEPQPHSTAPARGAGGTHIPTQGSKRS
jgi:hypothetical protein